MPVQARMALEVAYQSLLREARYGPAVDFYEAAMDALWRLGEASSNVTELVAGMFPIRRSISSEQLVSLARPRRARRY